FDSHQEMKWERVSNFLSIPVAIEKIIGFGIILCFDSFLYTFTILPIRAVLAAYRLFVNWITLKFKADIIRALLLITSLTILAPLTDASKIYHTIRLQETVKLYVIFNAVEPVATVMLSEVAVDWLKHAFITKFNHIRPSVYERYTDVLCLDLASGSAIGRHGARKHTYVDQSPLVARRLGFASLPLACMTFILAAQAFNASIASDSTQLRYYAQRYVKYGVLLTLAWAW
ncbi:5530_t:CDS:2, partial [Acaulospora colombiana]